MTHLSIVIICLYITVYIVEEMTGVPSVILGSQGGEYGDRSDDSVNKHI
jgi:hypothetical protein